MTAVNHCKLQLITYSDIAYRLNELIQAETLQLTDNLCNCVTVHTLYNVRRSGGWELHQESLLSAGTVCYTLTVSLTLIGSTWGSLCVSQVKVQSGWDVSEHGGLPQQEFSFLAEILIVTVTEVWGKLLVPRGEMESYFDVLVSGRRISVCFAQVLNRCRKEWSRMKEVGRLRWLQQRGSRREGQRSGMTDRWLWDVQWVINAGDSAYEVWHWLTASLCKTTDF